LWFSILWLSELLNYLAQVVVGLTRGSRRSLEASQAVAFSELLNYLAQVVVGLTRGSRRSLEASQAVARVYKM
jgi:hypothetical protein